MSEGRARETGAGGGGHFERFNAFMDEGWATRLPKPVATLYLGYLRHASAAHDFYSRPGRQLLAKYLGHASGENLRRYKRVLLGAGLILRADDFDDGSGTAKGAVFVMIPASLPPLPRTSLVRVDQRDPDQPDPDQPDPDQIGPENRTRLVRSLYKEEQHMNSRELRCAPLPAGKPPAARRTRERKLTDEQLGAWNAFRDWWTFEAWPGANGGAAYDFEGSRDGKACGLVLSDPNVRWDLDKAKRMASLYLADPDPFLVRFGYPLYHIVERRRNLAGLMNAGVTPEQRRAAREQNTGRGGRPGGATGYRTTATPAERGEYGGPIGCVVKKIPETEKELQAFLAQERARQDRLRPTKPTAAERGEFDELVGRLRVLNKGAEPSEGTR